MALSITAGSVLPASGYIRAGTYVAGESLTPFMPVYVSTSDGKVYKCDANDATKLAMIGVTMHTATTGQKVVIGAGIITVGAIVTVGKYYVCSPTAGSVMEVTDLANGDYVVQVGMGMTSTTIKVVPVNWGVVTPA